jgi:hypothetical protein
MFDVILAVLLCALILLNIWATARVGRDELSERPQKIAQAVAIWLFPFVGAMFVLNLLRMSPESGAGEYPQSAGESMEIDDAAGMQNSGRDTSLSDCGGHGSGDW